MFAARTAPPTVEMVVSKTERSAITEMQTPTNQTHPAEPTARSPDVVMVLSINWPENNATLSTLNHQLISPKTSEDGGATLNANKNAEAE